MSDLDNWLVHIAGQHDQGIDMGLARMQEMVQRLDLTRPANTVITIAGTNGKGTTAIAAEALLLAAGRTVGVTLSPHINHFNERIRIGGAMASDQIIGTAFAAVEAARKDLPLTYFEFSALAALWCFKNAQVEVAILEIGLGGRLDAFNVINADIAVITSIGLDHQEYLGDSLEQIGREKAGILRFGQHVVLGERMPQSVWMACSELQIKPMALGFDIAFEYASSDDSWQCKYLDRQIENIPTGNLSAHNLTLAFAAVNAVATTDAKFLSQVSRNIKMPGRLEIFEIQGRTVVHDVSHNAAGVDFLWHELRVRGLYPAHIICCMLSGKDHAEVYRVLTKYCTAPWTLVSSYGERALTSNELAKLMDISAPCFQTIEEGLEQVLSATAVGSVILIFGSFNCVEQSTWLVR
jgi:dihydrofolate synthase/folylpolyglutamate synthase